MFVLVSEGVLFASIHFSRSFQTSTKDLLWFMTVWKDWPWMITVIYNRYFCRYVRPLKHCNFVNCNSDLRPYCKTINQMIWLYTAAFPYHKFFQHHVTHHKPITAQLKVIYPVPRCKTRVVYRNQVNTWLMPVSFLQKGESTGHIFGFTYSWNMSTWKTNRLVF